MNWWQKLFHSCNKNFTAFEAYELNRPNYIERRKCNDCDKEYAVMVRPYGTETISLEWFNLAAKNYRSNR